MFIERLVGLFVGSSYCLDKLDIYVIESKVKDCVFCYTLSLRLHVEV